MNIFVSFEEGLLINVPGIFGAAHQVERQPQDVTIAAVEEHFKGGAIAGLCALDQRSFGQARGIAGAVVRRVRHTRSRQSDSKASERHTYQYRRSGKPNVSEQTLRSRAGGYLPILMTTTIFTRG